MDAALEVRGLTVRFGSLRAVDGVDVAVRRGEVVGIVGPNGAGKTTFLNVVTGYVRPEAGRVWVMGREITGLPPHRVTALGVGRSFQIPQLFLSLTVEDNVLIALAAGEGRALEAWRPLRGPERLAAARDLVGAFGLDRYRDRPVGELPAGVRKILDVALAFAVARRLLAMDEPTSGVSADEKFTVMDVVIRAIRTASLTAIFVEHDLEVVRRYADRVLVFQEGRIVADGSSADVLASHAQHLTMRG